MGKEDKVNLMEEVDQLVGDGEKWIRNNIFHTKCTSHGKICKVIIDTRSFENLVSKEMVQKLGLETVPHLNPL